MSNITQEQYDIEDVIKDIEDSSRLPKCSCDKTNSSCYGC